MKHFFNTIIFISLLSCNDVLAVNIDDIYYDLKGDSAIVTGCAGNISSIRIPKSIIYNEKNYKVTDIGKNAFFGKRIWSVTIEDGVKRIGSQAFMQCSDLYKITLPNSIEYIGKWAFQECKYLKAIEFPDFDIISWCTNSSNYYDNPVARSNGHIYKNYSRNIEVTEIDIPNGITELKDGTFDGCSFVTSIEIPSSVTKIGKYCFQNCSSLKKIDIPQGIEIIENGTFEGCKSLESITIPSSVHTIYDYKYGKGTFGDCIELKTVYIESNFEVVDSYGRFAPSWGSLFGSQVETYIFGKPVTNIERGQFNFCHQLKKIVFEGDISDIESNTFEYCRFLTTIEINSKKIGSWFGSISTLTSVFLGEDVEIIGNSAFDGCSGITDLKMSQNVKYFGDNAFKNCSGIKSFSLPKKLEHIGKSAFANCQMASITIPEKVDTIGASAFKDCTQLAKVVLSKGNLKCIGDEAFSQCPLTAIEIPDGVKKIGKLAFSNCKKLVNVSMPNSVDVLGVSAFSGCESLQNVTLSESLKRLSDNLFSGCSSITSVNLPNNLTAIGVSSFDGCNSLQEVNLPNNITSIGNNAFANCSNIATFNIPSSLKSIGSDAFNGCEKFQKVFVSDLAAWCNIKYGTWASNPLSYAHHLYREDGTEITDLVIPEGVESISDYAFRGGSSLTSITVPASLKKIGNSAFSECSSLSKVTISDLPAWCTASFGDNPLRYAGRLYDADGTEIQDLTIPDGVESVSSDAFRGCESLKSLVLSNGVKSVGGYAFANCANLAKVVIPNSVESISYGAFQNCLSLYSVTSLINMPFNLQNSAFQCTTGKYDQNIIYMAATLYVPRGRVDMYSKVEGWKKFTNIVETDTKFTLTYMLDGKVYKTYEIQATEVVTPEPDPYKEGYIFSGWSSIPSVMPAEDVTVYGSFAVDPNFAGIDGVTNDEAEPKAYYSVDGKRIETQQKGINIIRMSDGTTRKVVMK